MFIINIINNMANILYKKQKQQKSLDNGVTWIDTGEYRVGDILENPSNCTSEDSKQCRWVELDASEGYYCVGTTKYTVQVEECSKNGLIWTRTGEQQKGSTVIENNSTDCGGWTRFDPVYFSCYLNNMKNATFQGEIVINDSSNLNDYYESYCDLNNNYLFGNSQNGVVIINTKNGDLIKKDNTKCFVMDTEDTSAYDYGTAREVGTIGVGSAISANIFNHIFITYSNPYLIFQKFNGSGFTELYRISVGSFNFGYVRYRSTTNNYLYLWIQAFGVIRIDKSTLTCTQVTADDTLYSIPNELRKTIDDKVYYLGIEYGDYQCYYYSGNTDETPRIGYLNGKQIDFRVNFRISNYLIGSGYYGPNKMYIVNNNIFHTNDTIPRNFTCMGDNTYINLGCAEGKYIDFNDNIININHNAFTKNLCKSIYSEKYKVLITNDGVICDENGFKEYYNKLRCVFGYDIFNHIYPNGVLEVSNKYDDDCDAKFDNKWYFITYNEIIKRFDEYLDSIGFTTT